MLRKLSQNLATATAMALAAGVRNALASRLGTWFDMNRVSCSTRTAVPVAMSDAIAANGCSNDAV